MDFKSVDTVGLLLVIGDDKFIFANRELWMFPITGLAVIF